VRAREGDDRRPVSLDALGEASLRHADEVGDVDSPGSDEIGGSSRSGRRPTWRGWAEMVPYSRARRQDREESGRFGNRFPEDRDKPALEAWADRLLASASPVPSEPEPAWPVEGSTAERWARGLIDRARRGDGSAQREIADATRGLSREAFYKLCRQLAIPERRPRRKKPDSEASARTLRRRRRAAARVASDYERLVA